MCGKDIIFNIVIICLYKKLERLLVHFFCEKQSLKNHTLDKIKFSDGYHPSFCPSEGTIFTSLSGIGKK